MCGCKSKVTYEAGINIMLTNRFQNEMAGVHKENQTLVVNRIKWPN